MKRVLSFWSAVVFVVLAGWFFLATCAPHVHVHTPPPAPSPVVGPPSHKPPVVPHGGKTVSPPATPGVTGVRHYYVVQRGDCLWTIARRNHTTWQHIWHTNTTSIIHDPHWIYPGQLVSWS